MTKNNNSVWCMLGKDMTKIAKFPYFPNTVAEISRRILRIILHHHYHILILFFVVIITF